MRLREGRLPQFDTELGPFLPRASTQRRLTRDVSPGLQLPQPSLAGTRVTIRLRRVRAKTQVISLRRTSQTPIDTPNRPLRACDQIPNPANAENPRSAEIYFELDAENPRSAKVHSESDAENPRSAKIHFEPDPTSKLRDQAHVAIDETRALDNKQGRVEISVSRCKR